MPDPKESGQSDEEPKVRVTFNPFAFTVEENNAMIAKGWEPLIVTGVLRGV